MSRKSRFLRTAFQRTYLSRYSRFSHTFWRFWNFRPICRTLYFLMETPAPWKFPKFEIKKWIHLHPGNSRICPQTPLQTIKWPQKWAFRMISKQSEYWFEGNRTNSGRERSRQRYPARPLSWKGCTVHGDRWCWDRCRCSSVDPFSDWSCKNC